MAHFRLLATIAFMMLLGLPERCRCEENDWIDNLVAQLQEVEIECGLQMFYRKLFSTASEKQIEALTTCPHDGLALQASWEQFIHSVPPQLAKRHETKELKLDRVQLGRFLGFVKGRLKVEIPQWWDRELSQMTAIKIGSRETSPYYFGISTDEKEDNRPYHMTEFGLETPKEMKVTLGPNDQLQISVGRDSFLVPSWLLNKDQIQDFAFESLTALFTEKYCYLAMPNYGVPAGGYDLYCVRRTDGEKVWSSEADGPAAVVYSIGGPTRPPHYVTIVQKGERIYLFGGNMNSMYIEAFSAKDGKQLFWFCTLI